jgi:hypothetical protein
MMSRVLPTSIPIASTRWIELVVSHAAGATDHDPDFSGCGSRTNI